MILTYAAVVFGGRRLPWLLVIRPWLVNLGTTHRHSFLLLRWASSDIVKEIRC